MERKRSSPEIFVIPDDFARYMAEVFARLDGEEDDLPSGDDGLQWEHAFGGRKSDGSFSFVYFDENFRWEVTLTERDVRNIAMGALIHVPARRYEKGPTLARSGAVQPAGRPLLVWGPSSADALWIEDRETLSVALEALCSRAERLGPSAFRVWASSDDLLQVVLTGPESAVKFVRSNGRCQDSSGVTEQVEEFNAAGVDGETIQIPWSCCVDTGLALESVMTFVLTGRPFDGLPLGEEYFPFDSVTWSSRQGEVEKRGVVPASLAETSLAPWIV